MRNLSGLVCALALFFPPALEAREGMPKALPATIDAAVDMCIDFLGGKQPRASGGLRREDGGFVRIFPEGSPGTLPGKYRLNGLSQPRVALFLASDCACSIYSLRLAGGYKAHFAQARASFERRGWTYTRRSGTNLSKAARRMFLKGSKQRGKEGDVLTRIGVTEWPTATGGIVKRLRQCAKLG